MPSKSINQARLMAACSHGAGYDSCPPTKVSKEFNQMDKKTGILKKTYNTANNILKNGYHFHRMK